jgi:hypothetical protein
MKGKRLLGRSAVIGPMALTARRLVLVYAALAVLLNVAVLLPGNPDYSSSRGFVAAVLIQALVVWRLSRGSGFAWMFGLLIALGTLFATVLTTMPSSKVGVDLFGFISLMQVGVLAVLPVAGLSSLRRQPASP